MHLSGDGEIAIGKLHIEDPHDYGSVTVDEMVFFEEILSIDQIRVLSEYTTS